MQTTRRTFLRASMAAGTLSMAAAAGLLTPRAVLAAWPKAAFAAETMEGALTALLGSAQLVESDQVQVKTPDIAENGAVVSVTVKHSIAGAESLSILVPENANKLAGSYQLSEQIASFITGRIKMRKTSDVVAVVKAGDKLYTAKNRVKVTLGGCGG